MNPLLFRDSEYIPTRIEIEQASLEIGELERFMEEVDARVADLRVQLTFEQNRRNNLAHGIRLKKSMCAPIRRIPPEILGLIFENCVEPMSMQPDSTRFAILTENAPLLLTRVCRRWRCVAFDTPSLWTAINIGIDTIRTLNLPMIIPFWIANSHQLPFDIYICDTSDTPQGDVGRRTSREEYRSMMRLIQNELHRCRRLALAQASVVLPHLLPHGISMPRLEEFFDSSDYSIDSVYSIDAPNLRTLNITVDIHPDDLLKTFPSSRSLRTLDIRLDPLDAQEFFHFFAQFPELRHLTCMPASFEPQEGDYKVTLQHLESLDVIWEFCEILPTLNDFHFPSLQKLYLNCSFGDPSEEYATIHTLTNNSYSQTLKSLTLQRLGVFESDSFLQRLNVLEILTLQSCVGSHRALSFLARQLEDGSWLCPKLREVKVGSSTLEDLVPPLSDMISARGLGPNGGVHEEFRGDVCPLERIDLSVRSNVPEELVEKIRGMGIGIRRDYY